MSSLRKISTSEAVELGSPYPYTLVTSIDKNGRPNIMGLSWWMFTSGKPTMIAIAVGNTRYTHECIEYCKEFVICFPSEEQKEGAWLCGTASGRDGDKFKETGFTPIPSKVVKPPIIGDSTVAYECKVVDKMETGDHTLYVGEVVATYGIPEKPKHLFSIHYRKLVSLDFRGNLNFEL